MVQLPLSLLQRICASCPTLTFKIFSWVRCTMASSPGKTQESQILAPHQNPIHLTKSITFLAIQLREKTLAQFLVSSFVYSFFLFIWNTDFKVKMFLEHKDQAWTYAVIVNKIFSAVQLKKSCAEARRRDKVRSIFIFGMKLKTSYRRDRAGVQRQWWRSGSSWLQVERRVWESRTRTPTLIKKGSTLGLTHTHTIRICIHVFAKEKGKKQGGRGVANANRNLPRVIKHQPF